MSRRRKGALTGVLLLLILLTVYVLGSLWVSKNHLVVRKFTVHTGGNETGFRAVVIGDLHNHEFGEENETLVKTIEEQNPDLILMAGDMLNADSASPAVPVTLIEQLKNIAPVYYALGNHEIEYMEQTGEDLTKELTAAGAVVLDKAYVDLATEGVSIRLGGMYDYAFGTDKETGENLASAAPEDTAAFLQEFQDTRPPEDHALTSSGQLYLWRRQRGMGCGSCYQCA